MTDEQINRAIAEACGWTDLCEDTVSGMTPNGNRLILPDCCNCLNAMHRAEATLSAVEIRDYVYHLGRIDLAQKNWPAIHATARQRAEAFLRTLGKWEEAVGASCQKCGEKLWGHEDENGTHCRWCATGWLPDNGEQEEEARR